MNPSYTNIHDYITVGFVNWLMLLTPTKRTCYKPLDMITQGDPPQNRENLPYIHIIGVVGMPEIKIGDPLGELITKASVNQQTPIKNGDIVAVTQKIVSKSEGNLVDLKTVEPSTRALQLATETGRDPRLVELILSESRTIVRVDATRGIIISETKHGFICANSGIDTSNIPGDEIVALLPKDPDDSAQRIQNAICRLSKIERVAVIITDTFGRPWRDGHVNFAIGIANMDPVKDYRGTKDSFGDILKVTNIAVADEIAASSELVMAKSIGVPVAIVRGFPFTPFKSSINTLIRSKSTDLFR